MQTLQHTTAGIILIGTELLRGDTRERNSYYLVRRLRQLGVNLCEISIVRDATEDVARAMRRMAELYDHVFCAGGVGPGHDDHTLDGLRLVAGELELSQDFVDHISASKLADDERDAWLGEAELPVGTEVLRATGTWWPLLVAEPYVLMPGSPELLEILFGAVAHRFQSGKSYLRTVFVRIGDGALAATLRAVARDFPDVDFGSHPDHAAEDYDVRVTLESRTRARLDEAFARLVRDLDRRRVYKVVDGH